MGKVVQGRARSLEWEGRRKSRGNIKDGAVGAPARCLILFLEEDQRRECGEGGGREGKPAVPIPAGDKQAEEAYPM